MESLAKQFIEFLEDEGIGNVGENLFAGQIPAKMQKTNSGDMIVVRETGGLDASLYVPFFYPTLQVVVKNFEYDKAEEKMKEIHDLVHSTMRFDLQDGGYDVQIIRVIGHWTHVGVDENDCNTFAMNLVVEYKRDDLEDNY